MSNGVSSVTRPLPFVPSPEERGEIDGLPMHPLSPWKRGEGRRLTEIRLTSEQLCDDIETVIRETGMCISP